MAELLYFLLLKQRLGGIFLLEQTIQWNFQTSHQEGQSAGGSCSENQSVSSYLTRFISPQKNQSKSVSFEERRTHTIPKHMEVLSLLGNLKYHLVLPPTRKWYLFVCFSPTLCMLYVCVCVYMWMLLFSIKFGWVRKLFFSCQFRLQISRVK